jgi:flagellum-specific peptidoglycan hydrolase FlgJ
MKDIKETFRKYEVKAESIEDFLKRYTKPSRNEQRPEYYQTVRIKSHTEDLKKYGYTFITHHDSITGECVSYYGNK